MLDELDRLAVRDSIDLLPIFALIVRSPNVLFEGVVVEDILNAGWTSA